MGVVLPDKSLQMVDQLRVFLLVLHYLPPLWAESDPLFANVLLAPAFFTPDHSGQVAEYGPWCDVLLAFVDTVAKST